MTEEQFNEITEWQKKTFPNATKFSKLAHLDQELRELVMALHSENETEQGKQYEFADCFLLLFGAACAHGMTYDDICCAIAGKMEINEKRTWGKPDKDGVVNHIKE
jgi:hypothetical protein